MTNVVYAVAAVLQNTAQEIFMVQRPPHKPLGRLWEIPGGKVEPGETLERALCRELKEEIGIIVQPENLRPLAFVTHQYETLYLVLTTFHCTQWEGTISLNEGQESYEWVNLNAVSSYAMPPASGPLVERLKLLLTGQL